MNDMTAVIVPKSDQINADDLIGGPVTITIREVQIKGGQEQPVSIYFNGSDKAFRPCKSMSRVMVAAWGPDASTYKGRSLTLFRDPTVKWGGMDVGGIRISHMTDIDAPMTLALTATKGSRKPFVVRPLVAEVKQHTGGGLTIDQASDKLRAAFDLAELKTIWSNKAMAPFRDELGDVLAEMKASLGAQANANTDRGESHSISPNDLIRLIDTKVTQQDVIELVASWTDAIAAFDEADVLRIDQAKAQKIAEIKGVE